MLLQECVAVARHDDEGDEHEAEECNDIRPDIGDGVAVEGLIDVDHIIVPQWEEPAEVLEYRMHGRNREGETRERDT